ncbi:unnamed protein product, partial [Ixodes pacificus]
NFVYFNHGLQGSQWNVSPKLSIKMFATKFQAIGVLSVTFTAAHIIPNESVLHFKCPSLLIILSFGEDTSYIEGCSNWHWACSICSHQPTRVQKSVKSNQTYAKWKLLQEGQTNRTSLLLTISDPPTAHTVQCEQCCGGMGYWVWHPCGFQSYVAQPNRPAHLGHDPT